MNEEQKKTYVAWLNDAHALEENLITVLEKQVAEAQDKPEMRDRLAQHLEETKRHAALVRSCLARHKEDTSDTKDILAKASAAVGGFTMSFFEDAMVKNVHSGYAAEHAEIASYTVIRAAASEFGDMETVSVCDQILADENEMALWLLEQLPLVTVEHLKLHV